MISVTSGAERIRLTSEGEHTRVQGAFNANSHLRDKWYHADVDPTTNRKVMDITDEYIEVAEAFHREGADGIAREVVAAAVGLWGYDEVGERGHRFLNPGADADAREPVSGRMTFEGNGGGGGGGGVDA